jgi:hypothetical protein
LWPPPITMTSYLFMGDTGVRATLEQEREEQDAPVA